MKKITALFLALTLCLSLCTVTAFAKAETTVDDILKEANFPTTQDGNIVPENAWSNGKVVAYLNETKWLYFNNGTTNDWIIATNQVNNNKAQYDGFHIEFIKENNKLVGFKVVCEAGDDSYKWIEGTYTAPKNDSELKPLLIAAGITVVAVGTIHTVKAIKNYKAEKAAAAEAAKLAEMPMVRMGDSGDAVMTLQTELNAQGYNCGEADGVFGQNTLNAVKAFQTAKGLTADGVVGELTWTELL